MKYIKKLLNKYIRLHTKLNCFFWWVLFISVACLWMCVLFYSSFLCIHVCAYASKFMVHCLSALWPGASGLPYYCTPPVTVPDVIGALAVWRHKNRKREQIRHQDFRFLH